MMGWLILLILTMIHVHVNAVPGSVTKRSSMVLSAGWPRDAILEAPKTAGPAQNS